MAVLIAAVLIAACVAVAGAFVFLVLNVGAQRDGVGASRDVPLYVEDRRRDQPLPTWCEVEGDVLTLRVDESRIARVTVYNYPTFGPEGERPLADMDEAKSFLAMVNGRTFTACQTIDSWNKEREGLAGGYNTSVEFLDGNGDRVGLVSFDPAYPGDGIAVVEGGMIYQMDGDQSAVVAYLDDLVARLSGLESLQRREGMAG